MSAALDAAKAGYEVTVVEKEDALGGYAAKLRKQLPRADPYESLMPPIGRRTKSRQVEAESQDHR